MNRIEMYTRASERAAGMIIREYSTSFGLASGLLDAGCRRRIANIYALVRIADEIVDGASDGAGLSAEQAAHALNELEGQTDDALECGYSTNPIVQAFASTAREVGFGRELTQPFFASMRADLNEAEHDSESFARYVYGSAEVIGLMCLRVFLLGHERSPQQLATLENGARALGAAFQKVNFLRDLADDFEALGRSYFPGVDVAFFSEADKLRILDNVDAELRVSRHCLPLLPPGSRRAVALAQCLFGELARRLRATPADGILSARVRVSTPAKLRLAARSLAGGMPRP